MPKTIENLELDRDDSTSAPYREFARCRPGRAVTIPPGGELAYGAATVAVSPGPRTSSAAFLQDDPGLPTATRLIEWLADAWVRETWFESDLQSIYEHVAVSVLVKGGRATVPVALERMADEPERWSFVMSQITGAQPFGSETSRDRAAEKWSEWAASNGWLQYAD